MERLVRVIVIVTVAIIATVWTAEVLFLEIRWPSLATTAILFFVTLVLQTFFRLFRDDYPDQKVMLDPEKTARGVIGAILLIGSIILVWRTVGSPGDWIWVLGNIVIRLGLVLRCAAQLALRWNWSVGVKAASGGELIQMFPYSIIRHPMYTNYFTLGVGIFLMTRQYELAVIWVVYLVFVYRRAMLEEKLLEEVFGDKYREYKAKTGMFLPRIKWGK